MSFGQDPRLRAALEERRMGYVPAIAGNRRIDLEGGQVSAAEVAARVADRHWHRYRAGQGAKGPHRYAWAWACIDDNKTQGYRWLLIRRNLTNLGYNEPNPSALKLWITSRTRSSLVNASSATFWTVMPCAGHSTICAHRQVTTEPEPRRTIRSSRLPSSSSISRTRTRSAMPAF
ncbi:hypothetical protein GCM10010140_72480 [Streptosporangium pseudovulgare]|uniref:Uncharacterized protein n=1 Tax=Streptosporangium pseudovulgare TaxID=35765 RepID=A0ABQ2RH42_9ACTN|nr:hypothetical protein GCM10010140_72480 [Streptosporangium pseudovulgare]